MGEEKGANAGTSNRIYFVEIKDQFFKGVFQYSFQGFFKVFGTWYIDSSGQKNCDYILLFNHLDFHVKFLL